MLIDKVNYLTGIGSASAIVGTLFCLSRVVKPANGLKARRKFEDELKEIVAAQHLLKKYLYCSGLMLTAGLALVLSWMHWPADLITNDNVKKEYLSVVSALSIYTGVFYSLLIFSYYLPVSLILTERVRRYKKIETYSKEQNDDPQKPTPVLERQSHLENLKTVLAIVSPILAGVFGSIGTIGS